MRRYALKQDTTHKEIVETLRAAGCTVVTLSGVKGLPDLLVGVNRSTWLIEVKGPKGKLEASQVEWQKKWRGCEAIVVRSGPEALAALGLLAPDIAEVDGGSRSPSADHPFPASGDAKKGMHVA